MATEPVTEAELMALLRERIAYYGNARKFAYRAGVSPGLVSMTLSGKRPICGLIAHVLGYNLVKTVRTYRPIKGGKTT